MKESTEIQVAASLAVFAREDNSLLMIRRRYAPYKDKLAFPGGFMEVGKEDIFQTAVREFAEETGVHIKTSQISLLDIRSSPTRDPRGHVIDVGFLCIIPKSVSIAQVTEETYPTWFFINDIDPDELAFDHKEMLNAVKAELKRSFYFEST
jgi:8-oxo-dGTP diphosphatase